jgi:hypothetical protein
MNYCFLLKFNKLNPVPVPVLTDKDAAAVNAIWDADTTSFRKDEAYACSAAGGTFLSNCCVLPIGKKISDSSLRLCAPIASQRLECEQKSGQWSIFKACCQAKSNILLSKEILHCEQAFAPERKACERDGGKFDSDIHCCSEPKLDYDPKTYISEDYDICGAA